MSQSTPMSIGDLKRLQSAATHARVVRDFHAIEVRTLEARLAEQREALQQAEDAVADLDARVRAEFAPKLCEVAA